MTRPAIPPAAFRPRSAILPAAVAAALLAALLAATAFAALAALAALASPPALAEVVDFEFAADTREEWRRRAGTLGPSMTREGVAFRLVAHEARDASVVGDFNDWNPEATPLERSDAGLWKATVPIEDGAWRYLFFVDGEWMRDPENPAKRRAPESLEARGVGPDDEALECSFLHVRNGELVVPRPAGYHDTRAQLNGTYDRVNQAALFGGLHYENFSSLQPRLDFGLGFSFGRDRWLYDVGVTQPFFGAGAVDLGVAASRRNATPDGGCIDDVENTLATLFFREDWRDYYEAEGFAATAGWNVIEAQRFGVRLRREDHRAVVKTTDWGLFGGEKRMRDNPAMDEGELRALALTYDIDTRNDARNPTRGMRVGAAYEWAGEEFGGDFRFRKGVLDVRRYQEISPGYFADLRLSGGHLTRGERWMETEAADFGATNGVAKVDGWDAYPLQERFYLGGAGTMRATRFKSISGDRMLLANAELRVEIFRKFQAAVFADVGDAWSARTEDPEIHTDAGIGFQDSESSFRINFAKKMDRNDDEIFVSARIRRMF